MPETSEEHVRQSCEPARDSPLHVRADSLVVLLVAGINSGNASTVARLLNPHAGRDDEAFAATAIQGFRHHFDEATLTGCRFVEAHGGPDVHLEYRLVAVTGESKPVVAYHDSRSDQMWLYDEFLAAFPRAEHYAGAIVEAIARQDAERLARLLSVDDIDYPEHLAGEAIAAYARRFELSTLRVEFAGLGPGPDMEGAPAVNRPFLYRVAGTMDGRPVQHDVVVRHGDGLVGWHDALVPEYREE
jgi:hypothetical protein